MIFKKVTQSAQAASVGTGKSLATVTRAENKISKQGNEMIEVYFLPRKDKEDYREERLFIMGTYRNFPESASYKFMNIIGLIGNENEDIDISPDDILEAAKGKKFVIETESNQNDSFCVIKNIRLYRKNKASKAEKDGE